MWIIKDDYSSTNVTELISTRFTNLSTKVKVVNILVSKNVDRELCFAMTFCNSGVIQALKKAFEHYQLNDSQLKLGSDLKINLTYRHDDAVSIERFIFALELVEPSLRALRHKIKLVIKKPFTPKNNNIIVAGPVADVWSITGSYHDEQSIVGSTLVLRFENKQASTGVAVINIEKSNRSDVIELQATSLSVEFMTRLAEKIASQGLNKPEMTDSYMVVKSSSTVVVTEYIKVLIQLDPSLKAIKQGISRHLQIKYSDLNPFKRVVLPEWVKSWDFELVSSRSILDSATRRLCYDNMTVHHPLVRLYLKGYSDGGFNLEISSRIKLDFYALNRSQCIHSQSSFSYNIYFTFEAIWTFRAVLDYLDAEFSIHSITNEMNRLIGNVAADNLPKPSSCHSTAFMRYRDRHKPSFVYFDFKPTVFY